MAELIMHEESSTPSTPGSNKWSIYPKPSGVYVLDDAGSETQLISRNEAYRGFVAENSAQLTYVAGTAYKVEAGSAEVNGTLLTWASPITRSSLTLSSGTIHYVYLYSNAGTAALEESTTVPVWDRTLNYYKKTGDGTRRCIGYLQTSAVNVIRKFLNVVSGRNSEFVYIDGADAAGGKRVVSGGSSTASWTSFSLAQFVPFHASHVYINGKIAFTTSGDDGILAISPIDMGASLAQEGSFTIRDRGSANTTSTFFGQQWLPISTAQTQYYRTQNPAGSPTANIELHGARIIR